MFVCTQYNDRNTSLWLIVKNIERCYCYIFENCCWCIRVGPLEWPAAAADGYVWADYFFGRCCRCNRVGPSHMCIWLPIAISGLIFALGSAPDATGLTNCICICGCRWLCLGWLSFLESAPNVSGWTHCICECGCRWLRLGWFLLWEVLRCNRAGPLHMCMWLLMATSEPIFALGDVADAIGWAHHICICGCQ